MINAMYTFTLDMTAVLMCALLILLMLIGWIGSLHMKCRNAEKAYEEAKKEAQSGRENLARAFAKIEQLEKQLKQAEGTLDMLHDVKTLRMFSGQSEPKI